MVANGSEPGVLADTMDVIALGEGWCSACSKKAQEKYKKATITYANRSITVFLVKESVDPRSFRQTHATSDTSERSIRAIARKSISHSVSASSTDTLQQFVMKVAQAFDAFDGNLGGFRFWLEHAEPEARWSTIHDYHTGNLASLGIRAGGNLLFKKVRSRSASFPHTPSPPLTRSALLPSLASLAGDPDKGRRSRLDWPRVWADVGSAGRGLRGHCARVVVGL